MKCLISLFFCFMAHLNADVHTLRLCDLGCVRYFSDGSQIKQIERLSKMDELMYTCSYEYDENNNLVSECLTNAIGEIIYKNSFDSIDPQNQTKEPLAIFYTEYDPLGNLIRLEDKTFVYDEQNRLIKVTTPTSVIEYSYDASGKRLSRSLDGHKEYFVYHGINELARIDGTGNIIELRVPGISAHKDILRPIAIETQNAIYAPVQNLQGTITALIDISTGKEIPLAAANAFGEGLDQNAPVSWIFAGKYYDKEAGLIYFGARHYSPELGKWLTPDPMQQSSDPYLYCLGEPENFIDPDGQFAFAAPLISIAWGAGATITAPIWAPYAAAAAAGATIGYWGYKGYKHWQDSRDDSSFDLSVMERSKKGGIDPSLPKNPEKDKNWKDVSHPDAKKKGHNTYKNKETGEEIRLDKGRPNETGHEAHDHYHRLNPNSKGDRDKYLDQYGNPAPKGSDESHLYPPEWMWW
ncbi:MAG: RHS repeat-associated core domain-containing protein [Thaumarchaeota archaeon]|nr:RHS repeat-associated core domain-containing protein [Nitrososphaerota archaeon]